MGNKKHLITFWKISQRTYDLAKYAKEYIERKYHLKSIINTKRNDIIEKNKCDEYN